MQVSACLPCIGRAPAANNGLRLNRGINQASLLRTRPSPWQSRWTSSSPFSEVLNPPHSFRTLPRQLKFTHYLPCAQYPMQWMNTLFPVCVLFDLQTPLLELIQREGALSWASSREVKAGDTSCCERLSLVWTPMDTRDTHGWTPMDIHEHAGQRRGTS